MFSVLISFLGVSIITFASTTINENINTGGTLTVSGNAALGDNSTDLIKSTGSFYASSTLQTTGAARFYSTLTADGLTTLLNATTSLLTVSNGAWFTNGNIGISTTSPWGLLSINPNGISGPSFVIGSSTATNFVITNSGNVGIGTTSPGSLFSLNNIANFTTATSTFYGNGINLANGCFAINGTCAEAGGGGGTINSGATGQLSYYAGSGTTLTATSSLFIHSNQNIGIGTTTPNWLLQAAGVRPFLTLSDTGAAANNKHWFLSSQGGNFYVGTSSDAYATSTVSALTINSSGNVGIGTTSPTSALTINGNFTVGERGGTTWRGIITSTSTSAEDSAIFSTDMLKGQSFAVFGNGSAFLVARDATNNVEFAAGKSSTASEVFVGSMTAHDLSIRTNNGEKMKIFDSTGLVQIHQDPTNIAPLLELKADSATTGDGAALDFRTTTLDTANRYVARIAGVREGAGAINSMRFYTEDGSALLERMRITETGRIGIGTTTPTTMFQVATSTANATTTIEVGKANQTKGSCLKMYDVAGTLQYVSIQGGSFAISATSCE